MKLKKLLSKAEALFDSGQRERKAKKKHIKKVLKKLRSYEEKLATMLQEETDQAAAEKLRRKISLVHAQRKKGLSLMQHFSDNKKSDD
jgi:hypothetical protein